MKTTVIACAMLRDELEKAVAESGASLDVVWMEKGLHDRPELLRKALQEKIDAHQDSDVIVLAYGLCGNAVLGLSSETARLVIPKFDDCIRMLCSLEAERPPQVNPRCLYFTRGWIDSDKFILGECLRYGEKYSEKKARRILESMLGGYTGVCLIDTGAYETEPCEKILRTSAKKLGLEYGVVPGSARVLEKLAAGWYDGEFVVVQPGRPVSEDDFGDRVR